MKRFSLVRRCGQFAVAALIVIAVASLRAQDAATPTASRGDTNATITLDALVTEALAKNPELKFYEAEILATKAGRKTAGLLANPEVSTSLGQKSVKGSGATQEGLAWSATVMQPFEWPGRLGLRKAIANRDIELAELGYKRFQLALAARVRTLGYGLFAAQEKAEASEEVAERFKALRETLVQRDPAGLTPLLETRVIEATELNAARKATDASLAARAALLELNQLRGMPTDAQISVEKTDLSFRPAASAEVLVAHARTNSFEVRARAVELAQQGLRVDLAKNERYPTISVGPSISEERAGDRERVVGVGLSLPLPLWNRNGGNIAAAKARQTQAETSLYLTQRDAERQARQAALTYDTKVKEMSKWRPDSVQHFKEAAELADRHYRLGAVPIATYVELQKQYLEAVDGLLDTKKEALDAAVQLEVLTGLPSPLSHSTRTEGTK